jgi:hypothetical protein
MSTSDRSDETGISASPELKQAGRSAVPRSPDASVRRAPVSDYKATQRQIAELLSKQIFFIGGCARSGTTWLQLLLDAHPRISCRGEAHFVTDLAQSLKRAIQEHNEFILNKNRTLFHEIEGYPVFGSEHFNHLHATAILLLLLEQSKGKPALAVGEKTPENVQAFDGLSAIIPSAKFLHIVRDPRDAAVSGWYLGMRAIPAEMQAMHPTRAHFFKGYARGWGPEIERAIGFGARHPERYTELRYEDLLESPLPTLKRICRFLGVDDSDAIVERCFADTKFEKLSGGRPRGVEDESSHFRRGVVGDWRNHLDAETHAYFLAQAGTLMARFGYV